MNGERVVEVFRQEALEHERRKAKKLKDEYYDFMNEGFRHRKRSLKHLRPKKGRW